MVIGVIALIIATIIFSGNHVLDRFVLNNPNGTPTNISRAAKS
jgi:hypothetical protein